MNSLLGHCLVRITLALTAALLACSSPEDHARNEPLLEAETFHWCEQPLSLRPPPADWSRHRHNQGGLRGVWFTHRRSVGERIYVSEYYKVGQRGERDGSMGTYDLDDVVGETILTTEGWPLPADSFRVAEMLPDSVAGTAAYRLDFTLHTEEHALVGREYYFLQRGYLFEAAYLGLPQNLPLFERVVESIELPAPEVP